MAIRKIKDGYIVDFYNSQNRRKRLKFKTKTEAYAFERQMRLRKVDLVVQPKCEEKLLSEAIRLYVDTCTSQKEATSRNNEKLYFERMYDFLWEQEVLHVHEVSLQHLQHLQRWLASAHAISAATINRYFSTFNHFFQMCVHWKFHLELPCEYLKKLSVDDGIKRKLWSPEQMEEVIARVPEWCGDYLFALAETGARSGKEMSNVKFSDIDFEQRQVKMSTRKGIGGKLRTRIVPLTDGLFDLLWQKWQLARVEFGFAAAQRFVFLNSFGNYVVASVVDKHVRKACADLVKDGHPEYEGLVPYGLRHTMLTDLGKKNISLEKIRKLAGHAKLTTTQQYQQMDIADVKGALEQSQVINLKRVVTLGH